MPLTHRDFHNATNLAWLRVCRGLLKQMRCLDRDDTDRKAAMKIIDGMIDRLESRVYVDRR